MTVGKRQIAHMPSDGRGTDNVVADETSSEPSVGVVMAVYAGADPTHLEEALRSLEEQTLMPTDVVLVEDGPLTASQRLVVESFERGPLPLRRVALVERSGSGPARQRGLLEVTTELVAIADADDVSLPTRLECQAAAMSDGLLDVLGAAMEEFDAATGAVLGVRRFSQTHDEIKRQLALRNPMNQPAVMLRRSVVLREGGYRDVPFLEDYELWVRLAARGATLGNLDDVLVRFRGGEAAQRRRASARALKAELTLQRLLRENGMIPAWRIPVNLLIRSVYRILPVRLRMSTYASVFLRPRPSEPAMSDRPDYDEYRNMSDIRGPLAERFANQVLATVGVNPGAEAALTVLDVGSGYGDTALALADRCAHVTGLEPALELHEAAMKRARDTARHNMAFVHGGVEDLEASAAYDIVVLDNVYEHLSNQSLALERIARSLKDGGSLYLLVPNKLWPIEAHYSLPGLSWLPLRVANFYLRVTRRGRDYSDAMFAPTYWALRQELRRQGDFDFRFTLPADRTATVAGTPLHYRIGMGLIERFPSLWAISKALLVVAVRRPRS